jgi:hypothetical protein
MKKIMQRGKTIVLYVKKEHFGISKKPTTKVKITKNNKIQVKYFKINVVFKV